MSNRLFYLVTHTARIRQPAHIESTISVAIYDQVLSTNEHHITLCTLYVTLYIWHINDHTASVTLDTE